MERQEQALCYFCEGYNCAQAVFMAYCDLFGMNISQGKALCAGMGTGMGGLREKCGAVSSMFLLAGLATESSTNPMLEKRQLYSFIRNLNQTFEEKMGSSCCQTLLKTVIDLVTQNPSEQNEKYYQKRPCALFVKTASDIIEAQLLSILNNNRE